MRLSELEGHERILDIFRMYSDLSEEKIDDLSDLESDTGLTYYPPVHGGNVMDSNVNLLFDWLDTEQSLCLPRNFMLNLHQELVRRFGFSYTFRSAYEKASQWNQPILEVL